MRFFSDFSDAELLAIIQIQYKSLDARHLLDALGDQLFELGALQHAGRRVLFRLGDEMQQTARILAVLRCIQAAHAYRAQFQ